MKHIKYLRYIIRHKWFVMIACFRRGLIWQGIVHDWSKFLPCEWFPYVEKFYGYKPTEDDRRRVKCILGYDIYPQIEKTQADFDRAWLHHQHRNPHHWQHWVLREDGGDVKVLEMPAKFVQEMLADWEGAGMAITGKREYAKWYWRNREIIQLHPKTRIAVEFDLFGCVQPGETRTELAG